MRVRVRALEGREGKNETRWDQEGDHKRLLMSQNKLRVAGGRG